MNFIEFFTPLKNVLIFKLQKPSQIYYPHPHYSNIWDFNRYFNKILRFLYKFHVNFHLNFQNLKFQNLSPKIWNFQVFKFQLNRFLYKLFKKASKRYTKRCVQSSNYSDNSENRSFLYCLLNIKIQYSTPFFLSDFRAFWGSNLKYKAQFDLGSRLIKSGLQNRYHKYFTLKFHFHF